MKWGVWIVAAMLFCGTAQAEFSKAVGVMVGYPTWSFEEDTYYDVVAPNVKLFSETIIKPRSATKLEMALFRLGTLEDNIDGTLKIYSQGLSFALVQPLGGDSFSLRGKAGVYWANTTFEEGEWAAGEGSLGPFAGLGFQVDLSSRIALRGEMEVYHLDSYIYDMVVYTAQAGIVFNFAD